ncbi:unnamed protein product, partial [Symbiodinium sp. CCMP2592]
MAAPDPVSPVEAAVRAACFARTPHRTVQAVAAAVVSALSRQTPAVVAPRTAHVEQSKDSGCPIRGLSARGEADGQGGQTPTQAAAQSCEGSSSKEKDEASAAGAEGVSEAGAMAACDAASLVAAAIRAACDARAPRRTVAAVAAAAVAAVYRPAAVAAATRQPSRAREHAPTTGGDGGEREEERREAVRVKRRLKRQKKRAAKAAAATDKAMEETTYTAQAGQAGDAGSADGAVTTPRRSTAQNVFVKGHTGLTPPCKRHCAVPTEAAGLGDTQVENESVDGDGSGSAYIVETLFGDGPSALQLTSKVVHVNLFGGDVCISFWELVAPGVQPSRLWCVFELAAYKKVNPCGIISFRPLFVERVLVILLLSGASFGLCFVLVRSGSGGASMAYVGYALFVIPYGVAAVLLRRNFREKHMLRQELETFDLSKVSCAKEFDRKFILAAIEKWYGSQEAFTEYVQTELRQQLEPLLATSRFPTPYVLLVFASLITASLEFFLALWKGGAPPACLVSFAVGILVGVDIFLVGALIVFFSHICDRLAPQRLGRFDHLQTFLAMLLLTVVFGIGSSMGTVAYSSSLEHGFLF